MKKLSRFFIAGVCMVTLSGCASRFDYERYSSKDPQLGLSMDYVKGWFYKEHRGAAGSYAGVVFYENEGKDVVKALIGLTVRRSPADEPETQTLDDFAEDFISNSRSFKDMRLLSMSKTKLLGLRAVRMELSYKMPDKIYAPKANLVPARESVVIFEKDNKFYTVRYQNAAGKFKKYNGAFNHIIRSIEFKSPGS